MNDQDTLWRREDIKKYFSTAIKQNDYWERIENSKIDQHTYKNKEKISDSYVNKTSAIDFY